MIGQQPPYGSRQQKLRRGLGYPFHLRTPRRSPRVCDLSYMPQSRVRKSLILIMSTQVKRWGKTNRDGTPPQLVIGSSYCRNTVLADTWVWVNSNGDGNIAQLLDDVFCNAQRRDLSKKRCRGFSGFVGQRQRQEISSVKMRHPSAP